jgi:ATP-dependent protease ClpP protease subunit
MKFAYRTNNNAKVIAAFWGKSLADNISYNVRVLSEDETEHFVFDVLGWPFNDINVIIRDLAEIKSENLLVRLNSPGGDPIDTFAFYHALRNHSARVTVRIEALAASAASFLALAGDEVQSYSSSLMMINNSYILTIGNRFELI